MADRETVVDYLKEKNPNWTDEEVRSTLEEVVFSVFGGRTVCQFVSECDDGWEEALSTFRRVYG